MPGQTAVKFFLVHFLATNVVLSSFFVAQESGIFLGGSGKNHNIENLTCFGTNRNQSDFVHDTLHDWKEYLEPFVIEYILIVAGLLYSVLLHISKRKHQQKMKEVESGILDPKPIKQCDSMGKTGPDVEGSGQPSDKCDKIDSVIHKSLKSRKYQSQTYFLFVIGIIISITMIVCSLSLGDKKHYTFVLVADYSVQIFVYFTEILVSCSLLAQLSPHQYTTRNLKTDDKLLLFSMSLGVIAFDLFALIAAIGVNKEKEIIVEDIPKFKPLIPLILLLFFCVLNTISVCFETYAIIVTQRYKLRTTNEGCETAAMLRGGVLYLIAINLGHWAKNAFLELKHDGTKTYSIGQHFYHNFAWQLINRGIYPLCIFFRFHAAAMLVDIWSRFRCGLPTNNKVDPQPKDNKATSQLEESNDQPYSITNEEIKE